MKSLVVNAGSSSIKLSLFDRQHAAEHGEEPHGLRWERELSADAPLGDSLAALWTGSGAVLDGPRDIELVGHRIVHGGAALTTPALITPAVRGSIARVAEYAPAHNVAAMRGIDAVTSAAVAPSRPLLAADRWIRRWASPRSTASR
jgi:acetate kinase